MLGLGVAHADGDCDFRTILPADRAAMSAVIAASLRTLPPAPTGWVITQGDETPSPPRTICAELMRSPWAYSYTRDYSRMEKPAGSGDKVAQAAEALQKQSAAKQPKLDALMAQMTQLNEQIVALVQKGDIAATQPLAEKRGKLEEEYQRISDSGDATAGFEAAVQEQNRDAGFNITVDVNKGAEYVGPGATALPTPNGAQTALQYKQVAKEEDSTIGLVLLGTWRKADDNRWLLVARPGTRLTAAHGIAVIVRGPPERVASTLAAIDFSALAALLGK
jgi:hypothetical protein